MCMPSGCESSGQTPTGYLSFSVRRKARVDRNHAEIVQALRQVGWTVFDSSGTGNGFVDLVAARGGRLELIEVKDGAKAPSRRQLTEDEAKVHLAFAQAGVEVRIVESVEEAIRL